MCFVCFVFLRQNLSCSLSYPETYYEDQGGLEFKEPPSSAGIKGVHYHEWSNLCIFVVFSFLLNFCPCFILFFKYIKLLTFRNQRFYNCYRWWQRTPLILAPGKQTQEDLCEFEASLAY